MVKLKVTFALVLAALLPLSALAQPANKGRLNVSDELADAVVQKLEQTGKLDQAFERAIQRFMERQAKARQQAEEMQAKQQAEAAKKARKPDPAREYIRGPLNAEISLIEYSDTECPYCKQFHSVPKQLIAQFQGKLNWVWRHFPLSFHNPMAETEALAAECAGAQKTTEGFWAYVDKVMEETRSNGKGLPGENALTKLATAQGLDGEAFEACMKAGSLRSRIQADLEDGINAGINGTPGIILRNNRTGEVRAISGYRPAEALAPVIQQMLKGK